MDLRFFCEQVKNCRGSPKTDANLSAVGKIRSGVSNFFAPKKQDGNASNIEFFVVSQQHNDQDVLMLLIPGTNDWQDVKMDFNLRMHQFTLLVTQIAKVLARLIQRRGRALPKTEGGETGSAFTVTVDAPFSALSEIPPPQNYWADNELVPVESLGFRAQGDGQTDAQGEVHKGFYMAYMSIINTMMDALREPLKSHRELVIVGHSLGAAVGLFCGLHIQKFYPQLKIHLITFGSPKVGNSTFTQFCEGSMISYWRVINGVDIVPEYPPLPAFRHVGTARQLGERTGWKMGIGWLDNNWFNHHSINSYLKVLNKETSA